MILGFDFLGFPANKRFPSRSRIFLHVMQSTITKNSFLLVFYSYVTGMYLVCTPMYSFVTRMYLYVIRMYSCGVLVTIFIAKVCETYRRHKPVAEEGPGGVQCPPPAGNKIEIVPHQTKICSCLF